MCHVVNFLLVSAVLQRSLTMKEPALFSKSLRDSELRLWPKSGWPLHVILPNWLLPITPGLAIWFLAFTDMGPSSLLEVTPAWVVPLLLVTPDLQHQHQYLIWAPRNRRGKEEQGRVLVLPLFFLDLSRGQERMAYKEWLTAGFMQS